MIALASLPDGAIPLAVGTVLALGALAFVLWPLIGDAQVDDADSARQRANAAQRVCDQCGPRPEPDATYCSHCGNTLANV